MFMISKGHDLCPIMKTSKDSTDGPHIPFDKFYGKRGLQLAFCRKGIMLGKELSRFPLRRKPAANKSKKALSAKNLRIWFPFPQTLFL